ncbi:breast cancer metastasis-suppressor 1-like protein [Copidosoma floridanum]|uniref:breast cancer metastasis-suppressor 1-like protein n=1 Tax=Copidosoma floridanum TaxID=29053 RepID=UPI0006C977A0|nr:breast cancer metastasis-suppressor 1-like protein [Copidosoma floridanum]
MPSVKDESEAEGDEMSHVSNESNSSSASESSEEHSDSDESSEMDEEECHKRRRECVMNLEDIEEQFRLLRDRIYFEKITQVDRNLAELNREECKEYLKQVQKLKEIMQTKEQVAEVLKRFRLQNVNNLFESEELAAAQNLQSEKRLLYDEMYEELQEKIRKLEEDRNSSNIHDDMWSYNNGRKRKNRSQRRKAVTVSGPYIVYMLKENEIMEDWTVIKKSLTTYKPAVL